MPQRAPFPPGTLHAFAIKANPVGRLLQIMREAGLGAEVGLGRVCVCV